MIFGGQLNAREITSENVETNFLLTDLIE